MACTGYPAHYAQDRYLRSAHILVEVFSSVSVKMPGAATLCAKTKTVLVRFSILQQYLDFMNDGIAPNYHFPIISRGLELEPKDPSANA